MSSGSFPPKICTCRHVWKGPEHPVKDHAFRALLSLVVFCCEVLHGLKNLSKFHQHNSSTSGMRNKLPFFVCWTKNRGVKTPQIIHLLLFVHRVWKHYFHHPFWWGFSTTPYFWASTPSRVLVVDQWISEAVVQVIVMLCGRCPKPVQFSWTNVKSQKPGGKGQQKNPTPSEIKEFNQLLSFAAAWFCRILI